MARAAKVATPAPKRRRRAPRATARNRSRWRRARSRLAPGAAHHQHWTRGGGEEVGEEAAELELTVGVGQRRADHQQVVAAGGELAAHLGDRLAFAHPPAGAHAEALERAHRRLEEALDAAPQLGV